MKHILKKKSVDLLRVGKTSEFSDIKIIYNFEMYDKQQRKSIW